MSHHMHTSARDYELLAEIADYFKVLAGDSEACAARGLGSKRENLTRAKVWREAAEDVLSIRIKGIPYPDDTQPAEAAE